MLNRILFICLLLFIGPILLYGQTKEPVCGTDEYYQEKLKENPKLKQIEKRVNRLAKQKNISRKRPGKTTIIPVVFHVIYNDPESNVPKDKIMENLKTLNEDFQKRNSDTSQIRQVFKDRSADFGIEFRLAKADPNGKCTNGINRVKSDLTDNAGDNVKDLVQWDPDSYLNIWTVDNIARGNVSGYANFPWFSEDDDGIVLLNRNLEEGDRTLTHEVGHYLGLYHPFQGGCSSGNDQVDDTPPTESRNGRGVGCNGVDNCIYKQNPAGKDYPDMRENYMDYTPDRCQVMFTKGQKSRAEFFLPPSNNRNARTELVSKQNLIETGVKNESEKPAIGSLVAEKRYIYPCEKVEVSYNLDCSGGQLKSGTPTDVKWEFPNGNPSTIKKKNPEVSFDQPGTYKANLILSNSQGRDSIVKQDFIKVFGPDKVIKNFYYQGFEKDSYAANGFKIIPNNLGNGWERTKKVASLGDAALFLNNHSFDGGQVARFRLPKMNLSNISNPVLKFDLSYAKKNSSSVDILRIETSTSCGDFWAIQERFVSALDMPTSDPTTSSFFPKNKDDWGTFSLSLPKKQNLMVRFEWDAKTPGNNAFIDNIRMNYNLGRKEDKAGNQKAKIRVFPNPAKGKRVHIETRSQTIQTDLRVLDVTGRQLSVKENMTLGKGGSTTLSREALNINEKGVYYLQFSTGNRTITKKMVFIN